MIDTIKFGIPLTKKQFEKIEAQLLLNDQWNWVQFNPQLGELRFLRHKGLTTTDGESFHREFRYDIPDRYHPDECCLVGELSLPKYHQGHNIRLLYGWLDTLAELKKQLEKRFHCRFPPVTDWQLKRLDPCYAWQCPTQQAAQTLLNTLARLRYPRKKPTIRDTSIAFVGATYSFKFYLKYPEFRANDMKALIKAGAKLEWVNHLEKLATGVLRCEATLRRKYLVRTGLRTIGDLIQQEKKVEFQLNSELVAVDGHEISEQEKLGVLTCGFLLYQKTQGFDVVENIHNGVETPIKDGLSITAKAGTVHVIGNEYNFPGGTMHFKFVDKPVALLQGFLAKYVGLNRGMDEVGKVQEKLLAKYSRDKALRLMGFYLSVIKLGVAEVKSLYSERVYYRNKADLKAAEVSLLEPEYTVDLDQEFIDNFKFEIPSNYVTNRFDDFRDSANLLNEGGTDEVQN